MPKQEKRHLKILLNPYTSEWFFSSFFKGLIHKTIENKIAAFFRIMETLQQNG